MSCRFSLLMSFVLLMSVFVGTANADTTSDLISHWRLDDGSGTTAKDSAGVNDGTLKGDAAWTVGWVGGAVELDGDDDYVDCGEGTVFNTVCRDVITLAAWVKADPALGPDWGGIICRGYGLLFGDVSPYDTFAIYYHRSNNRLGFKTNSTSPDWLASPNGSAASVFDGGWHHVAAVYDGAEKVIYVDGAEIVREAATGEIGIGEGTGRVLLGGGRDAEPMVIEFGGLIDEARIYDRALTPDEVVAVMENIESMPYARGPNPPDGSMHMETWATLTWSAGDHAVSHDVYISDNLDQVKEGVAEAFAGNQIDTQLIVGFPGYPIPGGLVPGTTYYWRVDEVNEADPNSPWIGDVWSFSLPPKTAYNPDPADGAEFVDLDATLSWTGGYGAKLHTLYIGDNYDDVNDATAADGTPLGTVSYEPGTLEGEKAYYWRVDEFDGTETYKGDVWAFTTPGAVGNPVPANGATDVQMNTVLSWTAAENATSHELYFGTDAEAVRNATTASPEYAGPRALGAVNYDPGGLEWDSSYAWRVDEVYPTGTVKGLVWTFTTADFILVDDFEAYNDIEPPDPASNTIYSSWIDGYQVPTNGAITANEFPPYAEQAIFHGGDQSMKYLYDTNQKISESTLTLDYPKDWTEGGVSTLSLWFRGASANAAERMFVALNDNAAVYRDDPAATQINDWTEWMIDLQKFADQGVNLPNVNTITIGFGTKDTPAAGGTGTVYFDDIRLYR